VGISVSTALEFMLTSLLIELTPGPNMTYLTLVGVQAGRRDGDKAVAGVALLGVALGYCGQRVEAWTADTHSASPRSCLFV
jgi:threonine/homoserine/homoserine lactone efflux protein